MTDDFMGGGGGKSVRFDKVGDTVTGVISGPPEKKESRDDDGKPRTFDSGDIRYVWVFPILTDLRDPEDPLDEGERSLWLKWHSYEAVKKAIRASGAKGPEVGGTITLTLTGFGPKTKAIWNPPKLYSATYVPPPSGFMGAEPAAPYSTPPAAPYTASSDLHENLATLGATPVAPAPPKAAQTILERLAGQHERNAAARSTLPAHHSDTPIPF